MDPYDAWKLDDGYVEDPREVVGECFMCGYELHAAGEYNEADDFVEVAENLVCAECWDKFYKYIKKNGGII